MRSFYITLTLAAITNLQAQFFSKITTGPLVNTIGDSRSVNWADVNNDGWVDCFISNGPSGGQNNMLYINNNGTGFTTVTNDSIVSDKKPSDGASFADTDNDGDMDAFVVNWYNVNNLFYLNNGGGTFTKVDTGKIVNDLGYSETAAWGDYDKDGLVDAYVTNSAGGGKEFLYHNNGSNNFTKITAGPAVNDFFLSRCVNWTDIDGDNDLDLFLTNESNQNENIFRNDGGGTFTKLTGGPLLTNFGNTMSGSWGDFDNDGDLDVFLANDQSFNALFRNNGGFNFTKITTDTVVKTPSRSFSSAWSDVDNDGDLDLFVTNSFGTTSKQLNFFYLNNGSGGFTRNTTDIIANDSAWSYGCAFADYDNDGFEDLAVASCRFGSMDQPDMLYHNNTNSNKWITIKLTGTVSNRAAIGTKIRVKAIIGGNPVWQMREISSQTSYCGQNDIRAHFGLGNATLVDSIKIEWPLGIVEYYTNVNTNQFIQYIEGTTSTDVKGNENADPALIVFPNPNNGSFTLQLKTNIENAEVIMINSMGQKVHGQKLLQRTTPVVIKGLSNGLYHYVILKDKKVIGRGNLVIN